MRHEIDGGTSRCSCKWGGCKICWATNKQMSLHNDLMKFWLSKEKLRENLAKVNSYLDKIDSYTLYEFISGEIDEEKFNEALASFKTWIKKVIQTKRSEVVDTSWRVNPEKMCVYKWTSPRDRCIYCNSIRKYMNGKECLKYKETIGTTVVEN